MEDQQFDPDDMTGHSADGDAAADGATDSVGTRPVESRSVVETCRAETGTAEPHSGGAGRPVVAAAGAAAVVEVARVLPEVLWHEPVSESVGGAYGT